MATIDQQQYDNEFDNEDELVVESHRGAVAPGKRAGSYRRYAEAEQPSELAVRDDATDGVQSSETAPRVGAASGPALPHRDLMEKAFGQYLGDVEVRLGGARGEGAYATVESGRDVVAFERSTPSAEQVAHEMVHVAQRRRFGESSSGLAATNSAPEVEARSLASLAAAGHAVEVQSAPAGRVQRDASVAQRIHDNLHGWIDDEPAALRELRADTDRAGTISAYQRMFGYSLWGDFNDNANDATYRAALSLCWLHMTLIERLETHLGFDDDEDGIMQTIRNASVSEIRTARTRIQRFLNELDVPDQYEMRRLVWPEDPVANVGWLLSAGNGWVYDNEGPVATAILTLSPAQRVQMWRDYEHLITSMFSAGDKQQIRAMCITDDGEMATDADALRVRMELATDGLGTDEEGVTAAVATAGSRRDERARIAHALESGVDLDGTPLTTERRRVLETRRDRIGDVQGELLTAETASDGSLDDNSFLGRIQGDMDAGTVDAALVTARVDAQQRAKQALLGTQSDIGDVDEQAVIRIMREIQGEVELQDGETIESIGEAEARRRRNSSATQIRTDLRVDPDLRHIFSALGDWLWDDDEISMLDAAVSGDDFESARLELVEAYEGIDTDEAAILRILHATTPEVRRRLRAETPDPIGRIRGYFDEGTSMRSAFEHVLETGLMSTDMALDEAMGGGWDGTNVELVQQTLSGLSGSERAQLRRGYLLANRPAPPMPASSRESMAPPPRPRVNPADAVARERYNTLRARLRSELNDEDLDAALVAMLDIPSVAEMTAEDGSGRIDAAEIMLYRQRERLQLQAGAIMDAMTTTDDTAAAAHTEFESRYDAAREDGDITTEEFAVLVNLDTQFNDRFVAYQDAANIVADIAGTVAAVVAAAVVIILSEGTATPGVIAWLSANSSIIGGAAAAGAISQVVTAEALGGDFHQTLGAEGAREALAGAINGALMVCGAALAEKAAVLAGLSGRALTAAIARSAAQSVQTSVAGRAFARGALVGVIDGALGGAADGLVMTLTDAATWRRSVWGVLASAGASLLRGGLIGGSAGAVAGGGMEMAQALLRARSISQVAVTMQESGSRVHLTYELTPEGTLERLALRFGPETTDADLAAHVDAIVRIRRGASLLRRARTTAGTISGDAAEEANKIPDMISDRLRQLSGDVSPARRDILLSEIDVLQANLDEFARIARSGDMSAGTGMIARPDAPPGYPDPPPAHYYRRRGTGWDLQRRPHSEATPRTLVPDGAGGWRIVDRAEVTGGPVVRAEVGDGVEHTVSDGVRAEMDDVAATRLQQMGARDTAEVEVERLRGVLGLQDEDISRRNIEATLERLRTEHAADPAVLANVDELARQRGLLSGARRDLNRASETLGNRAAMSAMEDAGRVRLFGNPNPPGRSGEFDFIYVQRNADGGIDAIYVVEAKGASSSLGSASFGGVRSQQGSGAYMEGIARGMRPRDGSELDRVLRRIIDRTGDGASVHYVLVQAPVDSAGNALTPIVSQFRI